MTSLYDFLETNSLYIVMLIVLIIWIGIFGYMRSLDKKVKKLENNE
ncbi:MAG TPA: CcmD family protein [Ignavibacteria bacterium]|nr:CcmD family protein [Ignavibacteria bacterium]HQY52749.1 CcmD family protein [Ignavibacteria bacterium]HRB00559.1 CcmD family protein [Ignavibacteria bacterium]